MNNESEITYLLLSYVGEEVKHARFVLSVWNDLDTDPYGDHVTFTVGSNQRIVKAENASLYELSLAISDARENKVQIPKIPILNKAQ